MNYDGLLFGNGLSLNLLNQLKGFIDDDKKYLLSFDEFMQSFYNNKLSFNEDKRIFSIFYKNSKSLPLSNKQISMVNERYYIEIKQKFKEYFEYRTGNIEFWFGYDLFKAPKEVPYDMATLKNCMPSFYNVWHEILLDYLKFKNLYSIVSKFNDSIAKNLSNNSLIYTTNFDRFFDLLNPKHLHGYFVPNIKDINELLFKFINANKFYWKNIWGWNGIGKCQFIDEIRKISGYNNYFNFDFFYNNDTKINNLLIYGMGFQVSGYMTNSLQENDEIKELRIGGIIDSHILLRLKALQEKGILNNIIFSYFTHKDLEHYKRLIILFSLKSVSFVSVNDINFSIK